MISNIFVKKEKILFGLVGVAAVVKNNFENKSSQINKSYFEDENSFQNNGKKVTNINTNKSLEKQNNFTIKTGLGKEIQLSKIKKSLNYEVKQLSNSNSKSIENLLNFNNFENPKMKVENINISIEEVMLNPKNQIFQTRNERNLK